MDSRDWLYIKVFIGLYVTIAAISRFAWTGAPTVPDWRVGLYGALFGTILFAVVMVLKGLVSRVASSA